MLRDQKCEGCGEIFKAFIGNEEHCSKCSRENHHLAMIEVNKVIRKYTAQGWAISWCESCGAHMVLCPECGTNSCGNGTDGCGACPAAHQKDQEMWAELRELYPS